MKLFGLDLDRDVAVIAEIGVNHEGNVDTACRLVEAAAKAGADAVKFQSYTPERFIAATDPERFARVTRFGLDEDGHRQLAQVARGAGIAFFSSAITEDWVPLIAELGAAIKIASGDLTFEPVIAASAQTGKPVILSCGAGTVDEVDQAVGWFKAAAGKSDVSDQLALLHCVSGYPTPLEQANLLSIPFLAARYGLATGWSNHVIGPNACIAAVALGACIVEAHITDKKDGRAFRDHSLSFEPTELADLVKAVRGVRASLGTMDKQPSPCERDIAPSMRKGLVAARDLTAGTVLSADDLMYARPATEFAAADKASLVGRRLTVGLPRGAVLRRTALSN
jgi:N,N'-diacetyllegionaminate synthase